MRAPRPGGGTARVVVVLLLLGCCRTFGAKASQLIDTSVLVGNSVPGNAGVMQISVAYGVLVDTPLPRLESTVTSGEGCAGRPRVIVEGIPVTSVERVFLDMATMLGAQPLRSLLEAAQRKGSLTLTASYARSTEARGIGGRSVARRVGAPDRQPVGESAARLRSCSWS
jgi:hypothetical protein